MTAPQQHGPFTVDGGALVWRGGGETVRVDPWGRHAVRVRATRAGEVVDHDWALLPAPVGPGVVTRTTVTSDDARQEHRARMQVGDLTVLLTASRHEPWRTGHPTFRCEVAFVDRDGRVLLREEPPGGALDLQARRYRPRGGGAWRTTVTFAAQPGERRCGMGQYQQDALDLTGCTFELAHRNSQVSVPFVVSDRGYGFLWHDPAVGRATFATNRTEWEADHTDQIDYWVTAGATPAEVLARYADATGHVPMMPEYGLGFWQSKLRYWNQDQLLGVVREHVRRGLPLDVVVVDFFHWRRMGDFRFEEEFWPDPAAMVRELRTLGVELMVSVWPQVAFGSENYAALRGGNHLVTSRSGLDVQMWFDGEPCSFVDPTGPATRRWLREHVVDGYGAHGVQLFWLDEAEPELGVYDHEAYQVQAGPLARVANLYPQQLARAFHEGRTGPDGTAPVNLVRATWAGGQRHGALVWSGDVHSDWASLRRQVVAGLHMGMSGIAWFTTDIGGFAGGDPADAGFRELLVRWFGLATFLPVMRLHGDRTPAGPVTAADGSRRLPTGADNELWSFGEEVYEVLAGYVHLREKMRPYTRRAMREAHEHGAPVMRALVYDFGHDPQVWHVGDQFMHGPDVLVAPVLTPGARSRDVYLPAGATWTARDTGTVHPGGTWVHVSAPPEVTPVFARDGADPGW